MRNAFRHAAWSIGLVALVVTASAQSTRLTVDSICHPQQPVACRGTPETDITWLDAATLLDSKQTGNGYEWLKVDAVSGRTSPFFDADRMEAALASIAGVTRSEASLLARSDEFTFNPSHTSALLTISDDLYVY